MRVVYLLLVLQLHWVAGWKNDSMRSGSTSIEPVWKDHVQDRIEVRTLKHVSEATAITSLTVKAVAEAITDEGLKAFQGTLKNVASSLGIFGALLSAFLPDNTRIKLDQIQKSLEKIDDRLVSLSNQVDGLSINLKFAHALTRVNGYLTGLVTAGNAFDTYMHNPNTTAIINTIKDLYNNKQLIFSNINGVYTNVNGKISGINLFKEVYEKTNGNWYAIHSMYMHIQPMIVKSIATYTLGCKLNNETSCKETGDSLMGVDQKLQNELDNNLNNALADCRKNYAINRRKDVEDLLDNNQQVDNDAMAKLIANFVRKKYFWKDQTVLVYKGSVSGDNQHSGNGLYLHNIRERNVRILDGDTVPNTFSPSTTKPAKATRCDIVQNCNINNAHSLYGGPAWYDTISATSLRDTFVHTLTTKGFKSTQTSVIMKNKQTCSFDFDEQDSRLGWNLGKNGKMIVGGRKNENYCALGIGSMMMGSFMNNQAYFYLFVHLNDQEFACEGGDSCCGAGTICGEGEGDCDSDSDCTSGKHCCPTVLQVHITLQQVSEKISEILQNTANKCLI